MLKRDYEGDGDFSNSESIFSNEYLDPEARLQLLRQMINENQ